MQKYIREKLYLTGLYAKACLDNSYGGLRVRSNLFTEIQNGRLSERALYEKFVGVNYEEA